MKDSCAGGKRSTGGSSGVPVGTLGVVHKGRIGLIPCIDRGKTSLRLYKWTVSATENQWQV